MLSEGQRAHFDAFGFLALRGLFSQTEIDAIGEEADSILDEDRDGKPFAGDKRHAVLAFAERRPLLSSLVEDDRIYLPIEDLLGPGFMWIGSDGNLYVGDTAWHSDSRSDPREHGYTRIKVGLYLDTVTRETGCLRVIPGSHNLPLHDALEPMRHLRQEQQADDARKTKSEPMVTDARDGDQLSATAFGVPSSELPGFAIESEPGDAVFFNQRLWHSSFGGRAGRRMFTLNYGQKPTTDDHISVVKMVYEGSLKAAQRMQHTWTDQLYTDSFLNSDRPRIRSMMATPVELGLK